MDSRELETIASAAFGTEWKTPLAVELDMTRESVWRYATGRTPIPEQYKPMIRKICKRGIEQNLAKLEKALRLINKAH